MALLLVGLVVAAFVAMPACAISIAACNSFAQSTIGFGKCYIPSSDLDTWGSHEEMAVGLGMGFHLTSIHSVAENAFVRNFADSVGLTRGVWIGLNDFATEGTFVWSDSTLVDYLNWNPGEPNNLDNEDGVILSDASIFPAAGWNDYRVDFGDRPGQYAVYAAPLDIPGPSTLAVFGFALVGLGFAHRRAI